jgi:hypothetical protein
MRTRSEGSGTRVTEQPSHAGRDDGPIPGLRGLADVSPPPSLVPAVMRRVAEPRPVTFWSWLRRPRRIELRLSPLSAGALAVALAAGGYALSLQRSASFQPPGRPIAMTLPEAPSGGARPSSEDIVHVRFVLFAKGAQKVAVAGDFNGWRPEDTLLQNANGDGLFVTTVALPRGAHEYMFVVDGEWVTDPSAAEVRPDGFGRSNAVLRL